MPFCEVRFFPVRIIAVAVVVRFCKETWRNGKSAQQLWMQCSWTFRSFSNLQAVLQNCMTEPRDVFIALVALKTTSDIRGVKRGEHTFSSPQCTSSENSRAVFHLFFKISTDRHEKRTTDSSASFECFRDSGHWWVMNEIHSGQLKCKSKPKNP